MREGIECRRARFRYDLRNAWLYIYITCIVLLSYIFPHNSLIAFAVLAVMALPFAKQTEAFLAITVVTSPIAYFFSCSDEAVISLHTVTVMFMVLRIIRFGRISVTKGVVVRFLLVVSAFISCRVSQYDANNGYFELLYIVVVSLFVTVTPSIKIDLFIEKLLKASTWMLILVCSILLIFPYDAGGGKLSVSQGVNANTTSLELVYLITIIASTYFFVKRNRGIISIAFIGFFVFLISGSRNSLLSIVLTSILLYLFVAVRQKRVGKRIITLLVVACCGILFFDVLVGDYLEAKFNIGYVIQSGGTNRVAIWTKLIPHVAENYLWFGYGPSKGITSEIIRGFVGRTYSHSHNTFIEAFAETGIIGLSLFIWVLILCFRNLLDASKDNKSVYVLLGMFFCLITSSIGESYFNDIVLWLVIGISLRADLKKAERIST